MQSKNNSQEEPGKTVEEGNISLGQKGIPCGTSKQKHVKVVLSFQSLIAARNESEVEEVFNQVSLSNLPESFQKLRNRKEKVNGNETEKTKELQMMFYNSMNMSDDEFSLLCKHTLQLLSLWCPETSVSDIVKYKRWYSNIGDENNNLKVVEKTLDLVEGSANCSKDQQALIPKLKDGISIELPKQLCEQYKKCIKNVRNVVNPSHDHDSSKTVIDDNTYRGIGTTFFENRDHTYSTRPCKSSTTDIICETKNDACDDITSCVPILGSSQKRKQHKPIRLASQNEWTTVIEQDTNNNYPCINQLFIEDVSVFEELESETTVVSEPSEIESGESPQSTVRLAVKNELKNVIELDTNSHFPCINQLFIEDVPVFEEVEFESAVVSGPSEIKSDESPLSTLCLGVQNEWQNVIDLDTNSHFPCVNPLFIEAVPVFEEFESKGTVVSEPSEIECGESPQLDADDNVQINTIIIDTGDYLGRDDDVTCGNQGAEIYIESDSVETSCENKDFSDDEVKSDENCPTPGMNVSVCETGTARNERIVKEDTKDSLFLHDQKEVIKCWNALKANGSDPGECNTSNKETSIAKEDTKASVFREQKEVIECLNALKTNGSSSDANECDTSNKSTSFKKSAGENENDENDFGSSQEKIYENRRDVPLDLSLSRGTGNNRAAECCEVHQNDVLTVDPVYGTNSNYSDVQYFHSSTNFHRFNYGPAHESTFLPTFTPEIPHRLPTLAELTLPTAQSNKAEDSEIKKPFRCRSCQIPFRCRKQRSLHETEKHREEMCFICQVCNKTFISERSLKLHKAVKDHREDLSSWIYRQVKRHEMLVESGSDSETLLTNERQRYHSDPETVTQRREKDLFIPLIRKSNTNAEQVTLDDLKLTKSSFKRKVAGDWTIVFDDMLPRAASIQDRYSQGKQSLSCEVCSAEANPDVILVGDTVEDVVLNPVSNQSSYDLEDAVSRIPDTNDDQISENGALSSGLNNEIHSDDDTKTSLEIFTNKLDLIYCNKEMPKLTKVKKVDDYPDQSQSKTESTEIENSESDDNDITIPYDESFYCIDQEFKNDALKSDQKGILVVANSKVFEKGITENDESLDTVKDIKNVDKCARGTIDRNGISDKETDKRNYSNSGFVSGYGKTAVKNGGKTAVKNGSTGVDSFEEKSKSEMESSKINNNLECVDSKIFEVGIKEDTKIIDRCDIDKGTINAKGISDKGNCPKPGILTAYSKPAVKIGLTGIGNVEGESKSDRESSEIEDSEINVNHCNVKIPCNKSFNCIDQDIMNGVPNNGQKGMVVCVNSEIFQELTENDKILDAVEDKKHFDRCEIMQGTIERNSSDAVNETDEGHDSEYRFVSGCSKPDVNNDLPDSVEDKHSNESIKEKNDASTKHYCSLSVYDSTSLKLTSKSSVIKGSSQLLTGAVQFNLDGVLENINKTEGDSCCVVSDIHVNGYNRDGPLSSQETSKEKKVSNSFDGENDPTVDAFQADANGSSVKENVFVPLRRVACKSSYESSISPCTSSDIEFTFNYDTDDSCVITNLNEVAAKDCAASLAADEISWSSVSETNFGSDFDELYRNGSKCVKLEIEDVIVISDNEDNVSISDVKMIDRSDSVSKSVSEGLLLTSVSDHGMNDSITSISDILLKGSYFDINANHDHCDILNSTANDDNNGSLSKRNEVNVTKFKTDPDKDAIFKSLFEEEADELKSHENYIFDNPAMGVLVGSDPIKSYSKKELVKEFSDSPAKIVICNGKINYLCLLCKKHFRKYSAYDIHRRYGHEYSAIKDDVERSCQLSESLVSDDKPDDSLVQEPTGSSVEKAVGYGSMQNINGNVDDYIIEDIEIEDIEIYHDVGHGEAAARIVSNKQNEKPKCSFFVKCSFLSPKSRINTSDSFRNNAVEHHEKLELASVRLMRDSEETTIEEHSTSPPIPIPRSEDTGKVYGISPESGIDVESFIDSWFKTDQIENEFPISPVNLSLENALNDVNAFTKLSNRSESQNWHPPTEEGHPNASLRECSMCGEKFCRILDLMRHKNEFHKSNFKCPECLKTFANQGLLKFHLPYHKKMPKSSNAIGVHNSASSFPSEKLSTSSFDQNQPLDLPQTSSTVIEVSAQQYSEIASNKFQSQFESFQPVISDGMECQMTPVSAPWSASCSQPVLSPRPMTDPSTHIGLTSNSSNTQNFGNYFENPNNMPRKSQSFVLGPEVVNQRIALVNPEEAASAFHSDVLNESGVRQVEQAAMEELVALASQLSVPIVRINEKQFADGSVSFSTEKIPQTCVQSENLEHIQVFPDTSKSQGRISYSEERGDMLDLLASAVKESGLLNEDRADRVEEMRESSKVQKTNSSSKTPVVKKNWNLRKRKPKKKDEEEEQGRPKVEEKSRPSMTKRVKVRQEKSKLTYSSSVPKRRKVQSETEAAVGFISSEVGTVTSHSKLRETKSITSEISSKKEIYPCPGCDCLFGSLSGLNTHKNFCRQCKFCSQMFNDFNELTTHRTVHPKRYSCRSCKEKFHSRALQMAHEEIVHWKLNLACSICQKRFGNRKRLMNHMNNKIHE